MCIVMFHMILYERVADLAQEYGRLRHLGGFFEDQAQHTQVSRQARRLRLAIIMNSHSHLVIDLNRTDESLAAFRGLDLASRLLNTRFTAYRSQIELLHLVMSLFFVFCGFPE